eukprot:jgi/Mesvir1/20671/Mv14884-RA.1
MPGEMSPATASVNPSADHATKAKELVERAVSTLDALRATLTLWERELVGREVRLVNSEAALRKKEQAFARLQVGDHLREGGPENVLRGLVQAGNAPDVKTCLISCHFGVGKEAIGVFIRALSDAAPSAHRVVLDTLQLCMKEMLDVSQPASLRWKARLVVVQLLVALHDGAVPASGQPACEADAKQFANAYVQQLAANSFADKERNHATFLLLHFLLAFNVYGLFSADKLAEMICRASVVAHQDDSVACVSFIREFGLLSSAAAIARKLLERKHPSALHVIRDHALQGAGLDLGPSLAALVAHHDKARNGRLLRSLLAFASDHHLEAAVPGYESLVARLAAPEQGAAAASAVPAGSPGPAAAGSGSREVATGSHAAGTVPTPAAAAAAATIAVPAGTAAAAAAATAAPSTPHAAPAGAASSTLAAAASQTLADKPAGATTPSGAGTPSSSVPGPTLHQAPPSACAVGAAAAQLLEPPQGAGAGASASITAGAGAGAAAGEEAGACAGAADGSAVDRTVGGASSNDSPAPSTSNGDASVKPAGGAGANVVGDNLASAAAGAKDKRPPPTPDKAPGGRKRRKKGNGPQNGGEVVTAGGKGNTAKGGAPVVGPVGSAGTGLAGGNSGANRIGKRDGNAATSGGPTGASGNATATPAAATSTPAAKGSTPSAPSATQGPRADRPQGTSPSGNATSANARNGGGAAGGASTATPRSPAALPMAYQAQGGRASVHSMLAHAAMQGYGVRGASTSNNSSISNSIAGSHGVGGMASSQPFPISSANLTPLGRKPQDTAMARGLVTTQPAGAATVASISSANATPLGRKPTLGGASTSPYASTHLAIAQASPASLLPRNTLAGATGLGSYGSGASLSDYALFGASQASGGWPLASSPSSSMLGGGGASLLGTSSFRPSQGASTADAIQSYLRQSLGQGGGHTLAGHSAGLLSPQMQQQALYGVQGNLAGAAARDEQFLLSRVLGQSGYAGMFQ